MDAENEWKQKVWVLLHSMLIGLTDVIGSRLADMHTRHVQQKVKKRELHFPLVRKQNFQC